LLIIYKLMAKEIIRVEHLSKSFLLSHQEKERYTALRDVISRRAKKIFSFPRKDENRFETKEEFWALKDLSFTVEQGDRVGVIGRNGAGKSTLLKVLSRITEPSKGRITVKGRVASLLEVGTGFHPELTGRENIFLNGAILGMSRAEIKEKFDEIVSFAEVEKFLDTPVKRYSSGMYVRLAFAVAAHLEPEILVVDEVLAVGDTQFQKKCLGKMEDVSKKEGRTILFVSHNLVALQRLCDKAILLNKGSLEAVNTTSTVINQYLQQTIDTSLTWVAGQDHSSYKNDFINIKTARLYDHHDERNVEFTTATTLCVEITGEVLKESELLFDIHLYNEEGILVFDICSPPKIFPGSNIKAECKIPPHLLNDGQYSITVSLVLNHTIELFRIRDILSFGLSESSREINWHGKWPGIIRPKLEWGIVNL
jgi:lipopolysaccharide transport system ATP-binding protein